jgi:hypothetical protein
MDTASLCVRATGDNLPGVNLSSIIHTGKNYKD